MNSAKPGQVWIDNDGAAVLILEEGKALVLESYTVMDQDEYTLITRVDYLEGQLNLSIERCVSDQCKYYDLL